MKERERSLLSQPLTSRWHSWSTCTHFTSWQEWKKLLSLSACHVCSRRETSLVLIRTPAKSWGNCRSVCLSFTFLFPSLHSFSNSGGRNKSPEYDPNTNMCGRALDLHCIWQQCAQSGIYTSESRSRTGTGLRSEVTACRAQQELRVWLVNIGQVDAVIWKQKAFLWYMPFRTVKDNTLTLLICIFSLTTAVIDL